MTGSAMGFGIVEEVVRGLDALGGIGGADAERAHRRLDRPAHAVVEPHLLQALARLDLRAGLGVEGLAGGVL